MQNLLVTSIVWWLSRRFQNKEPSTSVVVPAESPMILMLAPGIGRLLLSVTIPEIEFCAKVKLQKNVKSKYTLGL
jgi:hypothetical protein